MNPFEREYIIDRLNQRKVGKDCLISFLQNQYSVPSEYAGKSVTVVALSNTLGIYFNGKQIALHKISYSKKDFIVNSAHYRKMTVKQSFDTENTLLRNTDLIDFSFTPKDLSVYDEIGGDFNG